MTQARQRPHRRLRFMSRRTANFGAPVILLSSAVVVGACSTKEVPYIEVPTTLAGVPKVVTSRGGNAVIGSIKPLEGTPITVVPSFENGTVAISGRVLGPDGPVEGATVVLTRWVNGVSGELRLVTDTDGKYSAEKIRGGVIEIYAYRIPDLSSGSSVILFAADQVVKDLQVGGLAGADIAWKLAAGKPIVGRPTTLSLSISTRQVDDTGRVGPRPVPGVLVRVVSIGSLQPQGEFERVTGDDGLVSFEVVCNAPGPSNLRIQLATGEETDVEPPACAPPPTTPPPTTSAPPPTEVPPSVVPVQPTLPPATAPPVEVSPTPPPGTPAPTPALTAPPTPGPTAPPTPAPPPAA
jgi:hypothetical protein